MHRLQSIIHRRCTSFSLCGKQSLLRCTVLGPGEKGRVKILLEGGKELLMKPANLVRPFAAAAMSSLKISEDQ